MKVPPTTRLEWEVRDERNTIATARPLRRDASQDNISKISSRHWRLIVSVSTLLLLASFISVARLVRRAEHNLAQSEREIALAVEAALWLRDLAAPKPHIRTIDLQNDRAIVHMSIDEGVHSGAGRGADLILFYRQSAGGWERMETDRADQDPLRFRENAHFLLQYDNRDQGTVEAILPSVETFSAELHHDIGLEVPPAHGKVPLRIAVVATPQVLEPFDLVGYVAWDKDGIAVLAPQFLRTSTTRASIDVLEQAIAATVAHRVILLAVEDYQPQAVWRPLIDGLQLWAYATPREFDSVLAYRMDNLLQQQFASGVPLRLPIVAALPLRDMEETQVTGWQYSVVPKTVIDYVTATYGRHSLARLLDGMHDYDSWQNLTPAVFGVSMEEFESSWQAYLAGQYASNR